MKSFFNFLKRQNKFLYLVILIAILLGSGIFIFRGGKSADTTVLVRHSDFINQVSVSGKVVASEEVDLGFKVGGIIERVFVSVGQGATASQVVKAGTPLVKIDSKDAEKAVHDAEVDLASARLSLEKLEVENSDENLSADLTQAYDSGFSTASEAFLDLLSVLNGLEDVLDDENISASNARNKGTTAVAYRTEAEKLYYEAKKLYKTSQANFALLNRNSAKDEIETSIDETYEATKLLSLALKSSKNLVDYFAGGRNDDSDLVDLQDSLSSYTNTTNTHLSSLLSIRTTIKNYKDAFLSTNLDAKDLLLSIQQEENSLLDAQKRLADYFIKAPFDGVVTKIDAKVGEIASANTPLVTMMSADVFQIESFVPEVNIALIKVGDEARATLDAYGDGAVFYATVVSIDPAETIRDGVSTYKIKLQFPEKDDRIKSGMTANVSIIIFNKPNVIVLPGGVVYEQDGRKFVQVVENKTISAREIITGATSILGQVEVTSGLNDGDMVILNPNVE